MRDINHTLDRVSDICTAQRAHTQSARVRGWKCKFPAPPHWHLEIRTREAGLIGRAGRDAAGRSMDAASQSAVSESVVCYRRNSRQCHTLTLALPLPATGRQPPALQQIAQPSAPNSSRQHKAASYLLLPIPLLTTRQDLGRLCLITLSSRSRSNSRERPISDGSEPERN